MRILPAPASAPAGRRPAVHIHRLSRIACALAFGLAACEGATNTSGVAEVRVSADAELLWQGRETEVRLSALDGSGDRIASPVVAWSSSDPAVLAVQPVEGAPERARVLGVGPGTATVVATVDGVRGSVPVAVEFGGVVRIDYSGGRSGRF